MIANKAVLSKIDRAIEATIFKGLSYNQWCFVSNFCYYKQVCARMILRHIICMNLKTCVHKTLLRTDELNARLVKYQTKLKVRLEQ